MKRKALVVDDDRGMVKTLSDLLRLKGWEVESAFDGETAVQAVRDDGFDVVIMDVKMPGMDGVSAFRAMKSHDPDVKVVLMTAYAAQELLMEAEREGVVQVMPKPVNVAQLFDLLAASLQRKQPVLLIDSDVQFLRTLSDVLTLRGYETLVAETLDDAMRAMEEQRPAAVLLHMHLADATPREAVVAVHDTSPAVALVLYSGRPGAADEIRQLVPSNWIHAYLQKPFAIDQVTGVLNAIGGH